MAGASRQCVVLYCKVNTVKLFIVSAAAAPSHSHSALIWNGSTTSLVGLATSFF
jgi:hypothetical protein